MKKDKWVKRWKVGNSKGDGYWTVAIDKDGNYGCSCPVWKFRREQCKHINYIKANPQQPDEVTIKHPDLVPAHIQKPTYQKEQNRILYPLVSFNSDIWMEATICYFLMEHGFSWTEVKARRQHIPNSWTKQAVYGHIENKGLAEYTNIDNIHDDSMQKQAS